MAAPRIFATADGKNHLVTFALVSSLFLLWGFCNGMIDVMDKHFQEELGLTLAQSYVHQHGGMIDVESRPGLTDFLIRLPIDLKWSQ